MYNLQFVTIILRRGSPFSDLDGRPFKIAHDMISKTIDFRPQHYCTFQYCGIFLNLILHIIAYTSYLTRDSANSKFAIHNISIFGYTMGIL